jgi:hypothetical protein
MTDREGQSGEHEQPRVQGRFARDELEVLREEQREPDEREDAQEVRGEPRAERRVPEEPDVEHGLRPPELAADEGPTRRQAGGEDEPGGGAAVVRDLLDAVDDRGGRCRDQQDARRVDGRRRGVA